MDAIDHMVSPSTSWKARLSKSRIALFEQCPRRLWLAVHRPELAEDSKALKASFAHGHEIGELPSRLLPDGHMISASRGLSAALDETANLIATGFDRPIFEATFDHDGVLIRADLLLPDGDAWHLAEVIHGPVVLPRSLNCLRRAQSSLGMPHLSAAACGASQMSVQSMTKPYCRSPRAWSICCRLQNAIITIVKCAAAGRSRLCCRLSRRDWITAILNMCNRGPTLKADISRQSIP